MTEIKIEIHPAPTSHVPTCQQNANTGRGPGLPLTVATSHLESPCGEECGPRRERQFQEAMQLLQGMGDCVYGGDMNWWVG